MSHALIMQIRPPVPDILGAENPGFAEAVDDAGAGLRPAGGVVGIIPVVAFAGANVVTKVAEVIGRRREKGIAMPGLVAPVRQRRIIVDAYSADRRTGPKRIQRKTHLVCIDHI